MRERGATCGRIITKQRFGSLYTSQVHVVKPRAKFGNWRRISSWAWLS
jgi:hypothetical protein